MKCAFKCVQRLLLHLLVHFVDTLNRILLTELLNRLRKWQRV